MVGAAVGFAFMLIAGMIFSALGGAVRCVALSPVDAAGAAVTALRAAVTAFGASGAPAAAALVVRHVPIFGHGHGFRASNR